MGVKQPFLLLPEDFLGIAKARKRSVYGLFSLAK